MRGALICGLIARLNGRTAVGTALPRSFCSGARSRLEWAPCCQCLCPDSLSSTARDNEETGQSAHMSLLPMPLTLCLSCARPDGRRDNGTRVRPEQSAHNHATIVTSNFVSAFRPPRKPLT